MSLEGGGTLEMNVPGQELSMVLDAEERSERRSYQVGRHGVGDVRRDLRRERGHFVKVLEPEQRRREEAKVQPSELLRSELCKHARRRRSGDRRASVSVAVPA